MPTFSEPIVPITLAAGGHTGITLYAPPWEDSDGEEWQGFLGDGAKIVLLGTVDELNTWLGDNPDHDLADHPAWEGFAKRGKKALKPDDDASYEFDEVYELAAETPTEESVAALAGLVDMAGRIAECCEDGALRSLIGNTREYALLVEGETDYEGKSGQPEWSRLGAVIGESWGRATNRLESWLRWEGSASAVRDEDEAFAQAQATEQADEDEDAIEARASRDAEDSDSDAK